MRWNLARNVSLYSTNHKKHVHFQFILTALSICTIWVVYAALTRPAISFEERNILVQTEYSQSLLGEVRAVHIAANASQEQIGRASCRERVYGLV